MLAEHPFYINIRDYHILFINNADDDTFYIRIDYHVLYIIVFGDGIFCINTVGYRILYMISSMATSSTSTSSTSTSPT